MSRADCDACDEFYTKNREQARIYRESSEAANRIIEQQMKEIASPQAELAKKDAEISELKRMLSFRTDVAVKNAMDRDVANARIHALEQQILTRDCQLRDKEQEICKWIEDRDIWIKRYEAAKADAEKEAALSEERRKIGSDAMQAIDRRNAYIGRLEAAFIWSDLSAQYHASMRFGIKYTEEQMQKKAKDALEKLRKG